MAEANLLLAALIERAGLSNAGLARRVNLLGAAHGLRYDHASVARWIRDGAVPRDPGPELICRVIGQALNAPVALADIGMERRKAAPVGMPLAQAVERASALWRGDQRDKAGGPPATGTDAIAPVWEWENPPDDLDVSRDGHAQVGTADVQRLRQLRARYQEMYRRVGGVPVRPRLVAALNEHAAPLLRNAYDNRTGRELLRAAGGLAALAGVCAYDADQQGLAQRYLFGALRMAKASGDKAFGAYVVALMSTHALHNNQPRLVVQYAESALRAARGHLSHALAADLHSLAGKAYARMGQSADCQRHMAESEWTAGRINQTDEPAEASYVQPGLIETQVAEALRRLGDLSAAQTYAEESVRTAGGTHLRGRVHRFAGLALIVAQRGDVDQAVHVGTQMLDYAEGMESGRIRDRVAQVTTALRPHARVPAVAEFLDRADTDAQLRGF
ncbi:hypothetical protein AB0J72_29305 [Dactylosporangium sp. NPDC049742]|uniref:hypothetical protein n=1 Tax=Dactylosporangium sp. NPDC049742 TaxID=3154737 RepID=UPI00344080BE